MTRVSKSDRDEAIARLRERLKPGDRVYTILRHVSRSGMQRVIDLQIIEIDKHYEKGRPQISWIGGLAARALGWRYDDKRHGIVVGGCGMDMGFHLVYSLGSVLFPKGFVPKDAGLRGRNGEPDTKIDPSGGYALRHEWL